MPSRPDRREDLLDAAAGLFLAQGLRSTTMESIARQAGAGKATLYRHFSDKDEVIDEVLAREARRFERRVRDAVVGAHDTADRVEVAFLACILQLVGHPWFDREDDPERDELYARVIDPRHGHVENLVALLAELIGDGVRDGAFRHVEPRAAAEIGIRVLLSYLSIPPIELDVREPDQAATVARVLTDSMRPHRAVAAGG